MTFDAKAYLRELESERTRKRNGESRLPAVAGAFPVTKWQKAYATTTHGNQLRGFQRTCFDICQRAGVQYSAGEAVERLKKLARGNEFYGLNEQDIEGLIEEQIACCEAARHPERRGVSDTGEPLDIGSDRGYQREAYFEERYERRGRVAERAPEREEWQARAQRETDERESNKPQDAGTLDEWDAGEDPGLIPPRQWLLGNQFCCGFISSIVAAGGAGKSALRLLQFISLALGRSLCGQHVFRRCRVLLISLEDDHDELQRRIKAVLDFFGIDRKELKGWLFCACPRVAKLAESRNRTRTIGPLEQQIRDAIARRKPDLVSLDPFIKTHSLEENASGDMDFVCDLLARIAIEFNVAVDSPHHVHKGQVTPGDADSGRGSSGIRDAGRLVYTLVPMSEAEAKIFNIEPKRRRFYVRLDSAKVNICAPSENAEWFRLHGQAIGNGTEEYPNGDTIQVVEPWSPPDAWTGTASMELNAILTEIDRGLTDDDGRPTGQRYSESPKARDRAVWRVVQKHYPDKSDGQCRTIIHAWLETGLLYSTKYDDPIEYKERSGLYVDNSKRPS